MTTRPRAGWWILGLTCLLVWAGGCPGELDADDDKGDDDVTGDDDTADDDATGDDDTVEPLEIDPERIYDDVAWLASDELGGRAPGTEGNEQAVEYLEEVFDGAGLARIGEDDGFRQYFSLAQWEQLGPPALSLDGDELTPGDDFTVFSYSGGGQVSGEVVFAGYGMTVPPFDPAQYPDCPLDPAGYDDYAGLDSAGKVALIVRHGPGDDEEIHDHCPANEAATGLPALWTFGYKAANARLHGATAMLLVNHYGASGGPPDGYLGSDYYAADFPALAVHRARVEAVVPELPGWVAQIDADTAPAGAPTGVQAALEVSAEVVETDVPNVLGALQGVDPDIGHEVIVVGAHLDHLGTDAGTAEIYNGADDNASGTAVMMELARVLASRGDPARTVLFAGWNAEEVGLVGSCYYVGDPVYSVDDTVAALSVDMVGAGDGSGLNLFGAMAPDDAWFAELMEAAADEAGLAHSVVPGPPSPNSDHACFSFAGTTGLLALSLGPHDSYHTPDDTIDGILIEDLEASAQLLWAALEPLAQGREGDYVDRAAAAARARARPEPGPPVPHRARDR